MSRNQREGRYAGAANGRHYRTRGVNCTVGSFDVAIEQHMRGLRIASREWPALWRWLQKMNAQAATQHTVATGGQHG